MDSTQSAQRDYYQNMFNNQSGGSIRGGSTNLQYGNSIQSYYQGQTPSAGEESGS